MKKDFAFWNDNGNVKYFIDKPADPRIAKYLEQIPGEDARELNALDLGCGGGRHTELLCKLGFKTYAVDINPAMLEATKQRVAQLHCDSMPIIQEGSITSIPFADKLFDIVVATGVLHQARTHKEYQQAIAELSRVCKDGAKVLLNIFTNRDPDPSYEFLDEEKTIVRTSEGLLMTLLSKGAFYTMMQDQGFKLDREYIEELKQENTGPRTILRARFTKE